MAKLLLHIEKRTTMRLFVIFYKKNTHQLLYFSKTDFVRFNFIGENLILSTDRPPGKKSLFHPLKDYHSINYINHVAFYLYKFLYCM